MHTHLKTKQVKILPQSLVGQIVSQALREDINCGDINALIIPSSKQSTARVITRQNMVLCGYNFVNEVFRQVDPKLDVSWYAHDGEKIPENMTIFQVQGNARAILSAERNVLNFLQMLSATATKTSHYINELRGTKTKILDTRKTIPGLRLAQKYAVSCGGGVNHRLGLFDAFLIKENHIASCNNSIAEAVRKARSIAPGKLVEVEVENFQQIEEALCVKVDLIMLDNFSLGGIKEAVRLINGKTQVEASGNITIENVRKIAHMGVDFISIGALTKNIQAIDLSMRFL